MEPLPSKPAGSPAGFDGFRGAVPMTDNSLAELTSFVGGTLALAALTTGLVLSLRYWSSDRSARLAAFGFVAGMSHILLRTVSVIESAMFGWTFSTPYSATLYLEPSNANFALALEAGIALSAVVSISLLVAALWTAWRRRQG